MGRTAALLAYGIGGLNEWTYFHDLIGLPLPIIALVIVEPGLFLALCVLLFRRLALQGRVLSAAFAVPALWVAAEYLGSLTSPHGTFGNIAYTQMNALPVIQIAAVTGIWGIGFLSLFVPTSIAALASTHASARLRFCAAAIALLLPAIAVAYGYSRLQVAPLEILCASVWCRWKSRSALPCTIPQARRSKRATSLQSTGSPHRERAPL